MNYTWIPSPLGEILGICQNGCLSGLYLPGQPHPDLQSAIRCDSEPVLMQVRFWLDAYFQGEKPALNFPLSPAGTAFQRQVWTMLQDIPYGESTTYGALAARFVRMSPQAVGQAVGANPISILIPCHRVLGSGGKLTGYAGGVEKKMFLLDLEGIPYQK